MLYTVCFFSTVQDEDLFSFFNSPPKHRHTFPPYLMELFHTWLNQLSVCAALQLFNYLQMRHIYGSGRHGWYTILFLAQILVIIDLIMISFLTLLKFLYTYQ